MFGFPFFTSLIVIMALVVGFSFVINKGLASRAKKSMPIDGIESKEPNCHI